MAKPTMKEKFAKKIEKDAITWLEDNGFSYPYTEAKNLECLPKFVVSYFKHHKQKLNFNEDSEPNA